MRFEAAVASMAAVMRLFRSAEEKQADAAAQAAFKKAIDVLSQRPRVVAAGRREAPGGREAVRSE
jgi:hypothetical protein